MVMENILEEGLYCEGYVGRRSLDLDKSLNDIQFIITL